MFTWIFAITLLFGFGTHTQAVFAQETALPTQPFSQGTTLSVSVNPGVVFLHIPPGQKQTHSVTITYTGKIPVSVTPELVEFAADNKTGNPKLLPTTQVSFVKLLEPINTFGGSFTMKPNSSVKVVVEAAPPAGTPDAEFPLTLLFKTAPTHVITAGGAAAQASAIIGSHMILSVANEQPTSAKITTESIETTQFLDSFGGLSFKVLLKNESISSGVVSGSAIIRNWLNQEVASYPFAKTAILGKSTRYAQVQLADNQDLTQTKDIFTYKPAYLLGPYSIEVKLTNPNQEQEITSRTSRNLLALPFSLSLAIGLAISTYIMFVLVRSRKIPLASL